MLRLIVLCSFFIFLTSAQVIVPATSLTQQPSQSSSSSSSSFVSSSFSLAFPSSSSLISAPTSISSTLATATATPTTAAQGPVDQPPSTTGTPGGPTPYTYTTIVDGVAQVVTAIFTPTTPPTSLSTPSLTGTILGYSSWLAIYGPTQTSSAGAGYLLPPIPFTLVLIVLLGVLGVLGGGGMLHV